VILLSFNVLKEPWIPAVDRHGTVKEVGILELLEKSPELVEIRDPSPLFQFGMYRLLITFLTDLYRPESPDDIGYWLEQGCFDMERIEKYVSDKFPRFDIFDVEHPFLQVKPNPKFEVESALKSVANLLPEMPTGNNDLLFNAVLENEHAFSPAVCAKALCCMGLFSTAGVQNYPSGVNGTPPLYLLIRGENLFETLAFNTWVPSLELTSYDDNVVWRSTRFIEPKKKVNDISYIEGLMWPTRRVCLVPDSRGGLCTYSGKMSAILIRQIYYQQGLNFDAYNLWQDPHTPSYTTKAGRSTLKPKPMKPIWRDIGPLLLLKSYQGEKRSLFRPPVVNQYFNLEDHRYIDSRLNISVEVYGLATDQAKFLTWQLERLYAPAVLARSTEEGQNLANLVQGCLDIGDKIAELLKGVVKRLPTQRSKGKTMDSLAERAEAGYWADMREIFFNEFLQLLKEADNSSEEVRKNHIIGWNSNVRITASKWLENSLEQMGNTSDVFRKGVQARANLNAGMNKIFG